MGCKNTLFKNLEEGTKTLAGVYPPFMTLLIINEL